MHSPLAITRRAALALGAVALPRFAIAQADTRPSITVAIQKISTSATLEPMREQSNVGQRILYSFAETMIELDWSRNLQQIPALAESWRRRDVAASLDLLQTSVDLQQSRAAFRCLLTICEPEDPAYTVLHQNATFTGKRKDLPWRAAQSFVMDFSPRNWASA